MSPTSDIYDHLTSHGHQRSKQFTKDSSNLFQSKLNGDNLHMFTKRKNIPFDEQDRLKRRYTVTHQSIPETTIHCSVTNQTYEKPLFGKSLTNQHISAPQQNNSKSHHIPLSFSNMEIKAMDFRPLIINGRRKLGSIPPSSSMIIVKKKSPSPMDHATPTNQKSLTRSIPVDIINSDAAMIISSVIPASLSYSSSYSSSSSTSASSANVGTVFLPIQVTKSQNNSNNSNNNNNNHNIKYSTIAVLHGGHRGYRYVQKQDEQQKSFTSLKIENQIPLNVDVDESTGIPSSSSSVGEGNNKPKSTMTMDSHVLRLIRRYDPVGENTTGAKERRSLENTRGVWHTVVSKSATSSQSPKSSSFLSRRSLTTTANEDETPIKQSSVPRLQRQQAIHEQEQEPLSSSSASANTPRPIHKYDSTRSRTEFIVQPHQAEPLKIEIEPPAPPTNANTSTYQPLITIGTKRVCSALSKSEWDLRLQHENVPIQTPSPTPIIAPNQQQEKESNQSTLGRSKSTVGINNNNHNDDGEQLNENDDFDETSAPIIGHGPCVNKLKQLFARKSSLELTQSPLTRQHRHESVDSNLSQHAQSNQPLNTSLSSAKTSPPLNSTETHIQKPTTIIQDVTPTSPFLNKKPILKSQKTTNSPESVDLPNNSNLMPSNELSSYDAYRYRRVNDNDQAAVRPRNVAKVEPYSINTNTVRPLYQSSSLTTTTSQPPATTITTPLATKSRINHDSMINTPTNSSISSSVGTAANIIRHPNVQHSDFLMPNPAYSATVPPSLSNSPAYQTPSSRLLSDSLAQSSPHKLSPVNVSSYNGRTNSSILSTHNFQQKYPSSPQGEFHAGTQTFSPRLNQSNFMSPTTRHNRPLPTIIANNNQQQQHMEMQKRTNFVEPQQEELISSGQQSRRRFQKRKQMKRSKSVDLCQDPSLFVSPTVHDDITKSQRHQKSTSREHLYGRGLSSPSSSSSSSSTADIERVNRAALLRYKSLDSMTFHNRKSNPNAKPNQNHNNNNARKTAPKPVTYDFDSDDSVCGIPKPRKLCTSSKNIAKSEGKLLDSTPFDREYRNNARATSVHNIGNDGTSMGITNSVRKNEAFNDRPYAMAESTPSTAKPRADNREGEHHVVDQRFAGISLGESQFYARSSDTPLSKRTEFISENVKEIYSSPSPPIEDTFQDAINDLDTNKEQTKDEIVDSNDEERIVEYQELIIHEPFNVVSPSSIQTVRPLSNIVIVNPFERLRFMDVQKPQPPSLSPSEDISLKIFDQPTFLPKHDEPFRDNSANLIRPLKPSVEHMQDLLNDNNDSSTSTTTTTTNRSIHLPVEKQRGLSEIIRKRNSRCKVEDYKRSIQKPMTCDDQQQGNAVQSPSRTDNELITIPNSVLEPQAEVDSKDFHKMNSLDLPNEIQTNGDDSGNSNNRARISIERLNLLLSKDEQLDQQKVLNEVDETMTVADKKNLFETILKDVQFGGTLPRAKSAKHDGSSITKKYAATNHHAHTDNILLLQQNYDTSSDKTTDNQTFDDDTSKLSFKEKMTLFNKNKPARLTPTSSLRNNRNRLTQPITAEEVQAAVNLTPAASSQQIEPSKQAYDDILLHENLSTLLSDLSISPRSQQHVKYIFALNDAIMSNPEDAENMVSVNKRLEQLKAQGEFDWQKQNQIQFKTGQEQTAISQRKTPTMKYSARNTNKDEQQHAKTVDIVRLKTDSATAVKVNNPTSPADNKPNGTPPPKVNHNIVSVLKSDTISVLKPDDHLDQFFADTDKNLSDVSSVQLNADDLNRIAENAVRLQPQASRARPPRRQQQGAKNPLRQIQASIPTENQYTEIHTNLSEQELRRLKRAQIAENAGFAQEALASLALSENFAEINLRRINQPFAKSSFEPYKELMLILIKGYRQCSPRLVDPKYESINEGDCYLLVTPLKVFAWLGRYANSLEKAKALEFIEYLKQHRDFGLRNEVKYFVLDQAKDDTENDSHAEFRDILQGEVDNFKLMNDTIDDDFYESNVTELNRVYRVENDLLMPLNDLCFRSLSFTMLDINEVFVFDFGSELYVWNGKYADKTKRNMGLQLAQQLWADQYDYSECVINPFDPLSDKYESANGLTSNRPAWCLFGKQNQNVETLLFKGKFYDWPIDSQDVKSMNDINNNNSNRLSATQRPQSIVEALKPVDPYQMLVAPNNPVNTTIEQIHLGRGRYWYDPIEMRGHHIQTIGLHVWLVCENDRHELSQSSYGHFYSDDVYVVRWKYKLLPVDSNNKVAERKPDISRDRVAYWIWQGINASPNEKGLSALMTILYDEEKGPHIHVIQEHEETTFLQLFDGTFTIHMGKRNQTKQKKSHWRLYVFLGEIDTETHWWELGVNSANLRSRTSFLLINNVENLMLLWHGYGTTEERQYLANRSALRIRERCAEEFHFDGDSEDIEFFEMQEGDEIELFWDGMNERNHERKYHSLLGTRVNPKQLITMRIFHLSSLHGPFVAQELLYPLRSPDHISAFPFTQSDLYELHQPALCLIDAHTELYIWQGWRDQFDDELGLQLFTANLLAHGPRDIRFTTERRCALLTAINYYKAKTGSATIDIPCSIVYAGLEPVDFINLFPKWSVHLKARQQNQLEGKRLNQKDSVIDVLKQLCREQYTIEELRTRPLPEGVDPSKIESYLSDADFQKEFRMTKDEFYALPYWKQTNIKKPLGFF